MIWINLCASCVQERGYSSVPLASTVKSLNSVINRALEFRVRVLGRMVFATPARTIGRMIVTSSASNTMLGFTWARRSASSKTMRVSHERGARINGLLQKSAIDVRASGLLVAEERPTNSVRKISSR